MSLVAAKDTIDMVERAKLHKEAMELASKADIVVLYLGLDEEPKQRV